MGEAVLVIILRAQFGRRQWLAINCRSQQTASRMAAKRLKSRLMEKLSRLMASAPKSSQNFARRGVSTWA